MQARVPNGAGSRLSLQSYHLMLLLIILVGFALRLYRIDAAPLRGDEAFSVQYWAGQPLADSLRTVATIEPHPLLTYAIFRGWGLAVGLDELPMRMLPALVNLLGIPALYALGKRFGGRNIGLMAALLWAIHPYEIWYAQDVRNYGLWAGVSAAALWLGYRAAGRDKRVDWVLYSVAATIAANIFYDELFTIAAFGVFLLLTRWGDWSLIRRAAVAIAFPIITSLLSFVVFQGGLLARGGYGGTAGNFASAKLLEFLTTLFFGTSLPDEWIPILAMLLLLATLAGLFLVWRGARERAIFLGLSAFLPLLILCIVSLKLKIFAPHYILSTVPAFMLIVAGTVGAGLRPFPTKFMRNLNPLLLLPILLLSGYSLYNYYFNPIEVKSPNWPAATGYMASYIQPDDLVIQLAIDPAFGYYYRSSALDIALPSEPAQTEAEIIEALEIYTADQPAVWLVGQPYPDWPNRNVVETWMQNNWQPVLDERVANLRVQQFRPWTVNQDELEATPMATFDDIAELVGLEIMYPGEVGDDLTVWLYWRAVGNSPTPLKVFVHLEGKVFPPTDAPIFTQDDQFPQDGRIGTESWTIGEVYRDVYQLPLEAGTLDDYRLHIGFYDPDSNERLTTQDGEDNFTYSVQRTILPR